MNPTEYPTIVKELIAIFAEIHLFDCNYHLLKRKEVLRMIFVIGLGLAGINIYQGGRGLGWW